MSELPTNQQLLTELDNAFGRILAAYITRLFRTDQQAALRVKAAIESGRVSFEWVNVAHPLGRPGFCRCTMIDDEGRKELFTIRGGEEAQH